MSVSRAKFMGGYANWGALSTHAGHQIDLRVGIRLNAVNVDVADGVLRVPQSIDNLPVRPGGPQFLLYNTGIHPVAVFDPWVEAVAGEDDVGVVDPGHVCTVILSEQPTGKRVWKMACKPNLPVSSDPTTTSLTTPPMTTAPMTTAPTTTAPMTTVMMTTAPMTTAPMTTTMMALVTTTAGTHTGLTMMGGALVGETTTGGGEKSMRASQIEEGM